MPKSRRKESQEEAARRKLADVQAKLRAAQEKRTRAMARGEKDVDAARAKAAARVEKATRNVERRAAQVARAEARLLARQDRKPAPPIARQTSPTIDLPLPVELPPDLEPDLPPAVAEAIEELEELGLQGESENVAGDLLLANSTSPTGDLSDTETGALNALMSAFGPEGATFTEWLNASGISRKTFLRVRKALVDRGLVRREGTGPGARYQAGA